MEKLIINGKTPLKGDVIISGAKNAAVAILPATLLINGICTIDNLPNISDVKIYCDILQDIGAKITWNNEHEITIDTRNINSFNTPLEKTSKFRASYYLIGSLLGRFKHAQVGMPGGCKLGARPIDQHIKAFEALGATVDVTQGKIIASAEKLVGNSIYLDVVSVGATINAMLAAVASRGDITVRNCITKHLEPLTAKIIEMGANVQDIDGDNIRVWCNNKPKKVNIKTLPYPGFPTDLQPQMGVALATASGTSIINESIWESRFQYTEELNKMGAKISAHGKTAVFDGVDSLTGAPVYASDLRAGAALIIAGISANGITEVYNLEHIDRGYENIEEKFRKLGANIERVVE